MSIFRIHVVFGKVIFGQAIVKQIEGLPVDRKSRPLQDVRISDSGELVLVKKKKKGQFAPEYSKIPFLIRFVFGVIFKILFKMNANRKKG